MSSNPIRLQLLLHKYIQNTATKAELEEFWKLMYELSDNDLVQLDIKNLWDTPADTNPSAEVNWDSAYHLLKQKIEAQEIDYTRKINAAKRRQYILLGAAASLMICVSVLWWKLSGRHSAISHQPSEAVYSQKPKQHRLQTISLPDGTIVTLNENSKLDYPPAFNQSTRDVYLTGEAFFDVKHNAQKPFLVHTGKFITKVLGTAFNIKAYPGDTAWAVTVTRGRVQVQSDSNKKPLGILSAGDQLVIDKISVGTSYTKANVEKVLEWKASDMEFDNATVDEATIALGNRFGAVFHFQNEQLRHCRFTADFSNDNLQQSLDIICTLIKAEWKQNKDTGVILIDGKGCD
ncbi:MAG: FecR domain-containing protein [Agriterribacter sp.]